VSYLQTLGFSTGKSRDVSWIAKSSLHKARVVVTPKLVLDARAMLDLES
jgi:hypothetical protein